MQSRIALVTGASSGLGFAVAAQLAERGARLAVSSRGGDRLTAAARRGKAIFEGKAGCAACHPHPTFTSMEKVDPGLGSGVLYDVPSLIEVWRTAPYLHNGISETLEEIWTRFNPDDRHGVTNDMTKDQLNDLIEYLKTL